MTRILVRTAQNPFKVYRPEASSRAMGGNAGNLLFGNGVARTLASRENTLSYGSYMAFKKPDLAAEAARINASCNHFVVPMSNSFRASFTADLERFTALIRMLDVPVTLVGVGGQATAAAMANDDYTMSRTGAQPSMKRSAAERHNDVVRSFCEEILERSREIGVRGEFTKSYLEAVGIPADRVRVIGCPSLYTWGPELRVEPKVSKLDKNSRVSMNINHRVARIDRVIAANLAAYPRITSPMQDSLSARMILSGMDQYDLEKVNLGTPVHTGHPMYASGSILFYPNPWGWIESFTEVDFTFGTRLHGNVASILAGTPAHLLAHDSRTAELADFHGIPHTRYDKDAEPPLAGDLFERTDYARFNELMPLRYQNFIDFLHANGLTTISDTDDGKAPAFDARIAKGRRTGAQRPAARPSFGRWVKEKAKAALRR